MEKNLILNTDSYKASHWVQYPQNTTHVYAYAESRGGLFEKTLFFGLQMWIKEYLLKPITIDMIKEAQEIFEAHGEPFNYGGWNYILKKHNGYLPLLIKAVPEGMIVPNNNVLSTIVNTDSNCYWLTSYIETQLLRAIWYPSTVATLSWHCKQIIKDAIKQSSDFPEQLEYKLHDFGARGVSSRESAYIGGLAHLVNFQGTDTIEAIVAGRKYYNISMAGYSIPAAEHSTITSWGPTNEIAAYENMLDNFAKTGKIVAVVSDSYDIYNAVDMIWGGVLKDKVKESGATVVIRPDSGNPLTVPIEVVEKLSNKFGFVVNSKGYKVLPSFIRVIQGDGINYQSLPVIINNLLKAGFAIDNLSFGMGGGLLQQVNRDTQKFALKTSAVCIDGQWRDVYKSPVGDATKSSKRGQLALMWQGDKLTTVSSKDLGEKDICRTVYLNGNLYNEDDLHTIRKRSEI